VRHEFLIVEAEVLGPTIFLRLERAAARTAPTDFTLLSISSVFRPDDTARVSISSEKLIAGEESDIRAEVRYSPLGRVTLGTLQVLLSSFIEISQTYSLTKENCWFFCSVVMQLLCERFPDHILKGRYGHEKLGGEARDAIRARFLSRLRATA
jgi:hypothetical protein